VSKKNINTLLMIMKKKLSLIIYEFDDGSEWMLSKCLTHANWTSNFNNNFLIRSGVQVSIRYFGYLRVRKKNSL